MIFNDFKGKKISALGMGCMRFPCVDIDGKNTVDMDATRKLIDSAIKNGINYFDTAWGYHGGMSEKVVGELLSDYDRSSFYLATKFPGYDVSNMPKVKEIFEEQLVRCRTDYFDFYLFHNVCEKNIDGYLNEQFGIFSYLCEQKKSGRIRHLGFSTHGSLCTIKRFLDAYGKEMEFCQLQINWLDWEFQNAKEKVSLVSSYGIPVWVMEPVRGGKLAKLEDEYEKKLRALRPNASTVEWAFRFLQDLPEAVVTLSGMSDLAQLEENVKIYSQKQPLTPDERNTLLAIANEMTSKTALPCTSCRYCVDHCPQELDIPMIIELYNEHKYSNGGFIAPMALDAIPDEKKPSACVSCRACEAVCPQGIKISEMMADFTKRL